MLVETGRITVVGGWNARLKATHCGHPRNAILSCPRIPSAASLVHLAFHSASRSYSRRSVARHSSGSSSSSSGVGLGSPAAPTSSVGPSTPGSPVPLSGGASKTVSVTMKLRATTGRDAVEGGGLGVVGGGVAAVERAFAGLLAVGRRAPIGRASAA